MQSFLEIDIQLTGTSFKGFVIMARLPGDQVSYSTLELFRDDNTSRAPQALGPLTTVGFDNTPELDGANSAPEVSKFA